MITTIMDNQYFKYSMLSSLEKSLYYDKIYKFLCRLTWEYPDFKQWYNGLFKANRELYVEREIIICEYNLRIAGIAILKSNDSEKKICTLRVAKEFQRQGIGRRLMELSFEWLEDEHPMITMHKMKQYQFKSLLEHYNFKLEQQQKSYYNIFSTEFVYNGMLPEKELLLNKIELLDMDRIYKTFILAGEFDFNKFLEKYVNNWYEKKYCKI